MTQPDHRYDEQDWQSRALRAEREVERLRTFLYALADDADGLAEAARRWANSDPA